MICSSWLAMTQDPSPLISIVKDVLNNIKQQKEWEEGNVESGQAKNKKKTPFSTKWTYFYWVARDQGSFEWVKGVMNKVTKLCRQSH